jgi:hypothetical protein
MNMLVRVHVRRIACHQPLERCELRRHLARHGAAVARRDDLVERHPIVVAERPLAEVDVEAER